MSPRKMFQSCGSSSIAVARMNRPMRVTRGSCSMAWRAPIVASASGIIERNFKASKGCRRFADALLAEEHRAAVLELDDDGQDQPDRQRGQQADAREHDVERALHARAPGSILDGQRTSSAPTAATACGARGAAASRQSSK